MTTTTRSNKRPKRATTRSSTTRSWPKNAKLDFCVVPQQHKCRLPEPNLCFHGTDWLLAACPISPTKLQVTAWHKTNLEHPSSMSLDISSKMVGSKFDVASGESFVMDQVGFLSTPDTVYLQVSLHNVPGLLLMEMDVTGENLIGEVSTLAASDLKTEKCSTDLGLLTSDGILASIVRTPHNKKQTAVLFDFKSTKCLGTHDIPLLDKDETTASWIRSGDDALLLWICSNSNEEPSSAVSSLLAWNGQFPLSFQNNIRLPPNIMTICKENPEGLLAVSKTKPAVAGTKKKKRQHALDQSGMAVLWLDLEQCKATTAGQACFSADLNPGWGHISHDLMWHPQEHHVLAVHNHSPSTMDDFTAPCMVGFAVDSETGKPLRYQTSNTTKTKQLMRTANTNIYQQYLAKGRTIASLAGNVALHKQEHVLAYVDWNVERVPGDADDQPFDDYQYQTVFQVHLVSST